MRNDDVRGGDPDRREGVDVGRGGGADEDDEDDGQCRRQEGIPEEEDA